MQHLRHFEGQAALEVDAFGLKKLQTLLYRERKEYTTKPLHTPPNGSPWGDNDGEYSFCVVEPVCTDGMYERKNGRINYIAEWSLKVVNLVDPEKQILVAKMDDI